MNGFAKLMVLLVTSILSNNFIFSRFLGCCPFLGVSNKVETAAGMGMAVTFVMGLASLFTWLVYNFILVPLHIEYLQTMAFILVIASLVQFVEMFLKKSSPSLSRGLGIYLPLITTNCAVLGVTLINITEGYNLLFAVCNGIFGALGFTLAIVLMAGVRERLEFSKMPDSLKGFSSSLIIAGLMSIAFLGFSGIGG